MSSALWNKKLSCPFCNGEFETTRLRASAIRVIEKHSAFVPDPVQAWPTGASVRGIAETFSVQPPISLYGTSKLASETLALEYGAGFDFPVWINRCGVLAGAGQFGACAGSALLSRVRRIA